MSIADTDPEDSLESESFRTGGEVRLLSMTEVVDAGRSSRSETLRKRALAVATRTITDVDLIAWFIEERGANSQATRENYEIQLRRLQCFAGEIVGMKKNPQALQNIQREDWAALVSYLTTPPVNHVPQRELNKITGKWDLVKGINKEGLTPLCADDKEWRPFKKRLGPSSIAQALTIITNFYRWLSSDGINALPANPFGGLRIPRPRIGQSAESQGISHYLEKKQWLYVIRAIDNMPITTPRSMRERARASWIFTLLVETGLRASEIATAWSSMMKPSSNGGWHLAIIRKGNIQSKTSLTSTTMAEWHRYRQACGVTAGVPGSSEDLPLVSQTVSNRMDRPMTRQSVWNVIKGVCAEAAKIARSEDDLYASTRLEECSPHWMRHTFGTWLVDSGADLRTVKSLMDHVSVSTTTIYLHTDAISQRSDLERMTASVPRRAPELP